MKKILFNIIMISVTVATSATAQNLVDAGRFGSSDIAGTARYRSMAGAFGALGGDASCMNDNPAGIGVFRGNSQLSISPTLSFAKTSTEGTETSKSKKNDMSVSNLAYIISIRPEGTDHLVNFNIGIGFNHNEGINRKYSLYNDNPRSSFGQYVQTRANNALRASGNWNNPDFLSSDDAWNSSDFPLVALMGYDSYTVDNRVNDQGANLGGVEAYNVTNKLQSYQRMSGTEKTRNDVYNINISGNWDDVIYAGLTLSIADFNSILKTNFYEDYAYNYDGDYTEYYNDLETQGSGVGLKFGAIYRPTDALRLGAAIHTPTWYDMKDIYDGAMRTNDENCTDYSYSGDEPYEYRYRYHSPWEYQVSAAYVLGTKAIISLEADLKDYASAKYNDASDSYYKGEYDGVNSLIKDYMQMQTTIKAGIEYRLTKEWSLRCGYAYQTSPYKSEVLEDNLGDTGWSYAGSDGNYWGDDRTTMLDSSTKPNYNLLDDTQYFCAGIGWSKGSWFVDLAFMDRLQNEKIAAYPTTQSVTFDKYWNASFSDGVYADHIDMKTNAMKWDLTIGYRF